MPKVPSSEVSSSKGVYRRAAWRPLDGEGGAVLAAVVWDLFHMFVSAIEVFLVRVSVRARVRVRVRVRLRVGVRVKVP